MLRILLAGFGNVGRRFVEILADQKAYPGLAELDVCIVGLTTGRHGAWQDPAGLSPEQILQTYREQGRFPQQLETLEAARTLDYDVLVELTPLNIARRGEPAISHLRSALQRGRHGISANKGPVAWALRELKALAHQNRVQFLHEATVMDGAPVFDLHRHCLRGNTLLKLDGILNSTSNVVLEQMEQGLSMSEAVAQAQAMGIAEADPSADLEGWDAAVKLSALANAMMDADLTPESIERQGMTGITAQHLATARAEGGRIKMLCEATRTEQGVRGRVSMQTFPLDHPFARVRGADSILRFHTDLLGRILVAEEDPDLSTTAYGVISDLMEIARR